MGRLLLVAPLLMLFGCAPSQSGPEVISPRKDTCHRASFSHLIGQPATVLDRLILSAGTRVLLPGVPMTDDYSPARLNIDVNAAGRITDMTCG